MSKVLSHTLSLQNLSIGFENPLLKNITLEIQSPCVVGVIGNNGKGKTTLLKNLAGLLPPLSGQLFFDGKNISGLSADERSKVVSMGFAANHVSFPVSVYELVSMGRYPYNNHWASLSNEDISVILQVMNVLGITGLQDKSVTGLSDGERQKSFVARVLAQQTPLILFDEPTAFFDYASKKQFFRTMKSLAGEEQKIIMISSHDVDFLTSYTDNLLMIGEDETVLYDTTEKISASGYFKAHFTK